MATKEELVLGPYVGAATDHTVIPLERDLWTSCGFVKTKLLVPDVWEQDNYLVCSLETKAEIVVPIIKDGVKYWSNRYRFSQKKRPFTDEDRELLEWLCVELKRFYKIL